MQTRRDRQSGITLVELLVGLALGMVLVLAMLQWQQTQVRWQRDTALDTRLMHDLKASGELVHRALRRAGRVAEPEAPAGTAVAVAAERRMASPRSAEFDVGDDGRSVAFWSARVELSGADAADASADASGDERIALRVAEGTLQMRIGAGSWQALTDRTLMRVTDLHVAIRPAAPSCAGATRAAVVEWRIAAESVRDRRVQRDWRGVTLLRHDGVAPAEGVVTDGPAPRPDLAACPRGLPALMPALVP